MRIQGTKWTVCFPTLRKLVKTPFLHNSSCLDESAYATAAEYLSNTVHSQWIVRKHNKQNFYIWSTHLYYFLCGTSGFEPAINYFEKYIQLFLCSMAIFLYPALSKIGWPELSFIINRNNDIRILTNYWRWRNFYHYQ